jgi:ABC-type glutathione transport system ATPase component
MPSHTTSASSSDSRPDKEMELQAFHAIPAVREVTKVGSTLSFKHLSYEVMDKSGPKRLVDDISVKVTAGELLAIMVDLSFSLR